MTVAFTAADSGNPKQGCPDNWGVTFSGGTTSAYLSLSKGGVEETAYARELVDTTYQWALLTPQSSGSGYTVVAYTAITGGSVISTSSSFTVAASSLPSLPLAETDKLAAIGDSTLAQGFILTGNPVNSSIQSLTTTALPLALNTLGFPVDSKIWPNYHYTSDNLASERAGGGGMLDAISSDATEPRGSGGDVTAFPGFISRLNRILVQRPQLLIVTVTCNDILTSVATATTIANYQSIADRAILSGCRVLFGMMRPCGISAGTNQTNRVAINDAIATICSTVTGCEFWDPSPVYTRSGGGPSAYNDTSATVDGDVTVGVHPTTLGAYGEAAAFIARVGTLGLFDSSANYALTVYDNAAGETSMTVAPDFNTGNNAGVSLSSGASGTFLNGIIAAAGAGTSKTSMVGSTASNPDTGGKMEVLTLTPAGTGAQSISVTMDGPTRSAPYTGYSGYAEAMMEVDIDTDTEALVSALSFQAGSLFGPTFYSLYYDGPATLAAGAANNAPIPSGVKKVWLYALFFIDIRNNNTQYKLIAQLDATGRTADAVIKIRRHYLRELDLVDYRENRLLPNRPVSLTVIGGSAGGRIPLQAVLDLSGVLPQGLRWWRRQVAASGNGWVYGGDVYVAPGVSTVNFIADGMTGGQQYDIKIQALRYGGTLASGFGRYHLESSDLVYTTITAASATNVSAILGVG